MSPKSCSRINLLQNLFTNTRAIVLHQLKYGESSLIVKTFTETHGLKSFLVKGVRKPKHRISPNLFGHLSLLEIEFRNQENKELLMAREFRSILPFIQVSTDIRRSSMALYMNELIYKSLREEEPNPPLFEFLITFVELLEQSPEISNDFHLRFAVQFTRFLGFFPSENYSSSNSVFNLKEGIFQTIPPEHEHFLEEPFSRCMFELAHGSWTKDLPLSISTAQRRTLLMRMGEFYRLHLPGFPILKSPEILGKVLD